MKALLICPDQRIALAGLAESAPLSAVPILGKSLVEYWIEHLVSLGAREIVVLGGDRPERLRAIVGDGARWGLHVDVISEDRELTPREVRMKYRRNGSVGWLTAPNDVIALDHLPGLPQFPLIGSYADWFAGVRALMPQALTPDRIGVHELQPGVWTGLHSRVAPNAKLIAPCWIGEHVWIEADAVVGPNAILEKEVFVAQGAEVSESVIGPDTFVGQFTEVHNSIAWGNTLINWERDSWVKVPDEFLLCSLEPHRARPVAVTRPAPQPALPTLRIREYVGEWLAALSAKITPPC
jgi:NDP-sugar pyrophosphorylase family protein